MADPGGSRFSGLFKRMVYKIANANLLVNTNIVPRDCNYLFLMDVLDTGQKNI